MTFCRLVIVERSQGSVVVGLDLPLTLVCHKDLPCESLRHCRARFQYRQREHAEDDLTEPLLGAIALPEIDQIASPGKRPFHFSSRLAADPLPL